MRSPHECLAILKRELYFPLEGDAFAYSRAHWYYECREAAKEIVKLADTCMNQEIARIQEAGLTSSSYKLTPVIRKTTHVLVDALRERFPGVFCKHVYLQNSDYVKILGRRTLYDMALAKRGADAIRPLERVNVEDIKSDVDDDGDDSSLKLLPAELEEVTEVIEKQVDWKVSMTDESLMSLYDIVHGVSKQGGATGEGILGAMGEGDVEISDDASKDTP